jgi:hypothetical protein
MRQMLKLKNLTFAPQALTTAPVRLVSFWSWVVPCVLSRVFRSPKIEQNRTISKSPKFRSRCTNNLRRGLRRSVDFGFWSFFGALEFGTWRVVVSDPRLSALDSRPNCASNLPERFDLMKKHTDGLTVPISPGNFYRGRNSSNSQRTLTRAFHWRHL